MSRKAYATLVFDGVDISDEIGGYITSLRYTDNEDGESDDLQITLQDRDGNWLSSWLSQAVDASLKPVSAGGSTSGGASYTVNAQSGLNMRTGPGMNYSKAGALPCGTAVTVTGTEGEWSKVSYNGQTVYMYSKYLTVSGGSESPDSLPQLKFGSTGAYVSKMQSLLIQKGQSLPVYGVDGIFRSETLAAVKAFQTAEAIAVDGICGPITWAHLLGTGSGSGDSGKRGFTISCTINREEWNDEASDTLDCGLFELDSVTASGPPDTVTVKATSLPYSASIRQTKKSKAWEAINLSGIAKEMCASNGMACQYQSAYDPVFAHVEQVDRSDISFLSSLAQRSGISVKATNNSVVLFDQSEFEAKPSVCSIVKGETAVERYSLTTSDTGTKYSSCRVRYVNPETGAVIEATVQAADYTGKNKQQLEITEKVLTIADAQTLALKMLRQANKYARTASFTVPGNPDLVAGNCVELSGYGLWDSKYIIERAVHSLGSGYTTQVSLRSVLEGY